MRSLFLFIPLLLWSAIAAAQTYGAIYRVEFTDKNNSPYSISNPEAFLSQRALERRQRMGIAVDQTDIPVVQSYIDGVKAKGAVIYNQSRWFNSATVFIEDTTIVPSIKSLPYVSGVYKTKPYFMQKKVKVLKGGGNSFDQFSLAGRIEHAARAGYEWDRISTDYGKGFNQANMIGVDYLHSMGFRGDGMVIAILDAGFYHVNTLSMFDSLRNDSRLLGYKDFVLPGNNVFEEATHGLNVASLIVGNMPGTLVGTAPHASVWLLRSEDSGSEFIVEEDNWIAAAEFADSVGADVINSSLGYTDFDDDSQSHTYEQLDGNTTRVSRGADMAASKGILVVNSAGNSGNDDWHYIGAPADADSILTIGAVDKEGGFAYFSSFGPSADNQIKPTVCAQGLDAYVCSTSDGVYASSGTSFSSPIMAGAVTCLWQANHDKSQMEIIESVKKSASRYSNPDSMFGYGIPNMMVANLILKGGPFEQPTSENKLMASPNPFSSEVDLILYVTSTITVRLSLVDNNGKVYWSDEDYICRPGYNYLLINELGKLASGVYFLSVSSDSWSSSSKLIKQ